MIGSALPGWVPHLEVWLLVLGLIGLGVYTARVIQPKVVAAGEPPITRHQKIWFWFGVLVFYVATDWPVHDIAEQRLYFVHMIQHSLLMIVFPPVMLLATPTWLARLIIGQGLFKRFVYFWARPAPALLVNLFLTAAMHWAWVVNSSIAERLAALRRAHARRRLVAAGLDVRVRPDPRAPGRPADEDARGLPAVDHPDPARGLPHHRRGGAVPGLQPADPPVGPVGAERPAAGRDHHEGDQRLLPLVHHRGHLLQVVAQRARREEEVPGQARPDRTGARRRRDADQPQPV